MKAEYPPLIGRVGAAQLSSQESKVLPEVCPPPGLRCEINPGGLIPPKLLFTDWTAVSHLPDGRPAGQTDCQREHWCRQEKGPALAMT